MEAPFSMPFSIFLDNKLKVTWNDFGRLVARNLIRHELRMQTMWIFQLDP